MIFKETLFEAVKENDLYKAKMKYGLEDESLSHFCPLTISSMLKEEYRTESFENEYIDSYLESARVLAMHNMEICHPSENAKLIFSNKTCLLPMLFMIRHAIELSIKKAISNIGKEPKQVHGLEKLWNSFNSYLPNTLSTEEENILTNMRVFVKCIDKLDETGTKLRYSKEKESLTQERFLWVNPLLIVDVTETFIFQLRNINFDKE